MTRTITNYPSSGLWPIYQTVFEDHEYGALETLPDPAEVVRLTLDAIPELFDDESRAHWARNLDLHGHWTPNGDYQLSSANEDTLTYISSSGAGVYGLVITRMEIMNPSMTIATCEVGTGEDNYSIIRVN